jgi:hypothetical protein
MTTHEGYSSTPLLQKLGYIPGRVSYVDSTAPYYTHVCDDITLGATEPYDFIHIFVRNHDELVRSSEYALPLLAKTGKLWVSWPKQAANVASDLTGNIIREYMLTTGLVDTKVAAIDATWSGLLFVYRVKER